MKKIAIFGAGLVVTPLAEYLLDKGQYQLSFLDQNLEKAQKFSQKYSHAHAYQVDIQDANKVASHVRQADIVISLLPNFLHPYVAEVCLEEQKSLITTSYVTSAMREFDQQAREKGLLFLNEAGLDPGLDHMSAMKIIDEIHEQGGQIRTFRSFCGGLPAPESNTNSWGYKFSWTPLGVLLAALQDARYQKEGEVIVIEAKDLLQAVSPIRVSSIDLETYPNRDSLPYIRLYNIPEVVDMMRGTLRYPGWLETMKALSELGFLDQKRQLDCKGQSKRQVVANILQTTSDGLEDTILSRITQNPQGVLQKFYSIGLLGEEPVTEEYNSILAWSAAMLWEKMQYQPQEKDMVVLFHEFRALFCEGRREQVITSNLVYQGESGERSAMAQSVSLPAAIAAEQILQGKVPLSGVHIPTHPSIYNPILEQLQNLGIVFQENRWFVN